MRTKLGLLSLCAMVAGIMSISVGAAQGATLRWLVLNSAGTVVTEIAEEGGKVNLLVELEGEKDTEHLSLEGELSGLKFAITCTNFTVSKIHLAALCKLTSGELVFTGCGVYKEAPLKEPIAGCEVKTGGAFGTVETKELKGELVLLGTKLVVKLEPVAGPTGTIASLQFGQTCVLTSPSVVHGTLYLEDCEGLMTNHAVKHLVQSDQVNTALYLGGHSAKQLEKTKVLGSAWVLLKGSHAGLKWSAMDV
jgi:hypothetical protein